MSAALAAAPDEREAKRQRWLARIPDAKQRRAWDDFTRPNAIKIPPIARFLVTVPASARPKMDVLWILAGFAVRGLMTRDEICDPIIADIHEVARRVRPDYPIERARDGVHRAFETYTSHIEAGLVAVQERIRWKLRGMMRAMPPTADDPEGRRRPTSAELLAAARAIAGDVLWTGPDHAIDEVTPVVEDEVLEAMRRQRMKRR